MHYNNSPMNMTSSFKKKKKKMHSIFKRSNAKKINIKVQKFIIFFLKKIVMYDCMINLLYKILNKCLILMKESEILLDISHAQLLQL